MQSKARFLGHPIHPMLIPFPIGLFATALIFDLIHAIDDHLQLARAAYFMIAAGILGGLLAAVFGAIDWAALPAETRAKRIATIHGAGNVVIVALFAVAWLLRRDEPLDAPTSSLILEIAGVLGALVTAGLGGELVTRLGVGVDRGAHLDAPSSLSGLPTGQSEVVTAPRGD